MMQDTFEIIVKSGSDKGASLSAISEQLKLIETLYNAILSSEIRPGSLRVQLNKTLKKATELTITQAAPKNSLNLKLKLPNSIVDDPTYYDLPARSKNKFKKSISAAYERDSDKVVELFPEKADRLRFLKTIKKLATPVESKPLHIINLSPQNDDIAFQELHSEWAISCYPDLSPERKTIQGVLLHGELNTKPVFKINDGNRKIKINADSTNVEKFREMFGKLIEFSGVVHYKNDGQISHVDGIENLEQFIYRINEIETKNFIYKLSDEIEFKTYTSWDCREFFFEQDQVNVYAHGRNLHQVIDAVAEDFEAQWEEIVKANDTELHESALVLKAYLKKLIISCEAKDV